MIPMDALAYPLPEDIEKLKWFGDFAGCISLIRQRMKENIPEALREKLRLEETQLRLMEQEYIITPEEAQRILSENLRDWKPEELEQLRRENVIDWIFVNGSVRYIDSFYDNLIKIRSDLAARQLHPSVLVPGEKTSPQIRDEIMAKMKREGTVTCRMELLASVELSDSLLDAPGELTVHVPIPVEQDQMRNVKILSCSPGGSIAPGNAPQRTVCFRGSAEALRRCEVRYTLDNVMTYVEPKPENVSPQQPDFYTGEQLPHIAFTPYLRALTAEIVGGETNPLLKARRIYDFITSKVVYSYMRSYLALPVIPEYCASRLRGDCGVQALTFITMCRIAGIPARWQSGLYADWREAGSHDWAMFYVAPYGWMWTDCSFGGAAFREGAEERRDFYFSNLDPYRVCLASEFQADFTPETRFQRHDPYDNQRGEVELSDRAADPRLWSGNTEVLSFCFAENE